LSHLAGNIKIGHREMTPYQMNWNKQMTRHITLSRVILGYFLRCVAVLNCAAVDLKSKLPSVSTTAA